MVCCIDLYPKWRWEKKYDHEEDARALLSTLSQIRLVVHILYWPPRQFDNINNQNENNQDGMLAQLGHGGSPQPRTWQLLQRLYSPQRGVLMFIAITMRWPNVHINHSEVFYASGPESFISIVIYWSHVLSTWYQVDLIEYILKSIRTTCFPLAGRWDKALTSQGILT